MRGFLFYCLVTGSLVSGQIPDLPIVGKATAATPFGLPNVTGPGTRSSVPPVAHKSTISEYRNLNQSRASEIIRLDVEQNEKRIREETAYRKTFLLEPMSGKKGTQAYYTAFNNLLHLNPDDYSLTDAVFLVENAYYNNDKNFQNTFQASVQRATDFLRNGVKGSDIQQLDNLSKNLAIFKYFTQDTKQNGKIVHRAVKYDFDDYLGQGDYSKMFVSKLMKSNSGQCHSMPLLYLILAEQIGAEAHLVMSPNHSYIRFKDDNNEDLSIELTNGMFSANSFVLNSGYIKAEALKNKLYMKDLSKREVLSQTFVDLASGYIHKYGYDEFVASVLDRALILNPNNINATLWKSNTDQVRFLQACARFDINPEDREQLQKIRGIPPLAQQFHEINSGFEYIDQSGYSEMPPEQYQNWLTSFSASENKQKSDEIAEKIRMITQQKQREAAKKMKPMTPKPEAPKLYKIPKEFL